MGEWERRESRLSLVRVTYVISSGAGWDVMQRAIDQGKAEYTELAGLDRDASVPPEAVTFAGYGQGVAVCIEVEVEEPDGEPEPGPGVDVEQPEEVEGRG